jgi:hypothetical protein
MPDSPDDLPDFHPQTVLRDLEDGQGFRLADALTGVCAFSATGSGKISGLAKQRKPAPLGPSVDNLKP